MQGDLAGAVAQFGEVAAEAEAAHDEIWRATSLAVQGIALAYQGETAAARAAADAAVEAAAELGGSYRGRRATRRWLSRPWPPAMLRRRRTRREAAWPAHECPARRTAAMQRALECRRPRWRAGISLAARRWADDAVSTATGWYLAMALTTRARVAIAQGEPEQAERDAHDALAMRRRTQGVPAHPRHPRVPRRSGRRGRQSPRSRPALRRGTRHPATHRRGPLQGLGRRLRSLGGGAARCHGREGL